MVRSVEEITNELFDRIFSKGDGRLNKLFTVAFFEENKNELQVCQMFHQEMKDAMNMPAHLINGHYMRDFITNHRVQIDDLLNNKGAFYIASDSELDNRLDNVCIYIIEGTKKQYEQVNEEEKTESAPTPSEPEIVKVEEAVAETPVTEKDDEELFDDVEELEDEVFEDKSVKEEKVASSTSIARDNIIKEMQRVDDEIYELESSINKGGIFSKANYVKLSQLKSYREKLFEIGESLNKDGFNDELIKLDESEEVVKDKIYQTNVELNAEKRKAFRSIKKHKIEQLKKKQGFIKKVQTKLIDRELKDLYSKTKRESRNDISNKIDGINNFYQNKEELESSKIADLKSNIIPKGEIKGKLPNKIATNVSNINYTIRKAPSEIKLFIIKNLHKFDVFIHGKININELINGISDDIEDSKATKFINNRINSLKEFKYAILNSMTYEAPVEEHSRVRS